MTRKVFLVSYRHEGSKWSLEMPARDLEDAKARLAKLAFGTIDGEIRATIPVVPRWIARLFG